MEKGEAVHQAAGPDDWLTECAGQLGLVTPEHLKDVDGVQRRCGEEAAEPMTLQAP